MFKFKKDLESDDPKLRKDYLDSIILMKFCTENTILGIAEQKKICEKKEYIWYYNQLKRIDKDMASELYE